MLSALSSRRCRAVPLSVLLLAAPLPAFAQPADADAPPPISRELRGAWVASVANIDWPSRPGLSSWEQQAELLAILNRAVALNLNAIVLQVRPAADALYDSPYEPWSEYLTGIQGRAPEPYYDPLRFAVEAAHARGLELHAWFNPYRTRHPSGQPAAARTHVSAAHPELVREYGRYGWMDPGEPAVMARTLRVMLDVVRRYDIDGIHIDDYFYPYPELAADGGILPFPDSASYAAWRQRGGTLGLDDWRRHNVDTLVREIYRRTKALKPWVKVGISPFGIWRSGHPPEIAGFDPYDRLYADSRRWLREGWVDYFSPQLYWPIGHPTLSYAALLRWWMGENVLGRHLWVGHNINRAAGGSWPADELLEQIRLTRAEGGDGAIHFSMRALMPAHLVRPDTILVGVATPPPPREAAEALTERLRAELYATPALVPRSAWLAHGAPARPATTLRTDSATGDHVLRIEPGRGGTVARWWTVRARVDGAWRSWVLPAGQHRLVVAPAAAGRPTRVVVTAVDRYGTEGPAAELPRTAPGPSNDSRTGHSRLNNGPSQFQPDLGES